MFPFSLQNGLNSPGPAPSNPPLPNLVSITGSNTIQGARYIDLRTGDYAVDTNGNFLGMDSVNQQVLMSLFTVFGTSAAPIGDTILNIKTFTSGLQGQVTSIVQSALANIINSGDITLNSATATKNPNGQLFLNINYTNNTIGQNVQTNIPIPVG